MDDNSCDDDANDDYYYYYYYYHYYYYFFLFYLIYFFCKLYLIIPPITGTFQIQTLSPWCRQRPSWLPSSGCWSPGVCGSCQISFHQQPLKNPEELRSSTSRPKHPLCFLICFFTFFSCASFPCLPCDLPWPLTSRPPHGPSVTVQVLFALNATALLYFHLRTCRTDPGFIRVTEEEKKMVRNPEEPRAESSCLAWCSSWALCVSVCVRMCWCWLKPAAWTPGSSARPAWWVSGLLLCGFYSKSFLSLGGNVEDQSGAC